MTRKAFAGIYRCSCGYQGARYFFDSEPTETKCGRCDDGMAQFVRKVIAPDATKARAAKKRLRSTT